jgi:hypothetical protein
VLALVLVSFFFIAAAPDTHWAASVLVLIQAWTLAVATWTSGLTGRANILPLGLLAVGIAGAVGQVASTTRVSTGAFGLVNILLVAGTCGVIARGVAQQRVINPESVLGAISVYLLIGIAYTFAFGAIAAFDSDPFFMQGTSGAPAERLYFSFVTLTTVGYGDYSAASDLGRTLSATESLLAQLYLVTVVAVLVSRLGRGREATRA